MVYSLHLPLPSDCGSISKAWWKTKHLHTRAKKVGALRVHQQALVSGDACLHGIRQELWTITCTRPIVRSPAYFSPCHIPICQSHNPRWQQSPSTLSQWINEWKDTFSHTVDRHGPMPTLMLTHDVRMCRPRKHDVVVVLWRGGRGCAARSFSRP